MKSPRHTSSSSYKIANVNGREETPNHESEGYDRSRTPNDISYLGDDS